MWLTNRITNRTLPCYSHWDTIATCILDAKCPCLRIFTNHLVAPTTSLALLYRLNLVQTSIKSTDICYTFALHKDYTRAPQDLKTHAPPEWFAVHLCGPHRFAGWWEQSRGKCRMGTCTRRLSDFLLHLLQIPFVSLSFPFPPVTQANQLQKQNNHTTWMSVVPRKPSGSFIF